jgi:MFS family permease
VRAGRYRELGALLAAAAISVTGNRIALLAVPWFVLQTTGSAAKAGISAFAYFAPMVLATFFGGTLVDRVGLRRSSVVADLASGLTVAAIPLLHLAGLLQFWSLVALVFAGTLLDAPGDTARRALLPDLAATARLPLERATSAHETVYRTSQLVGGPLAGLLIASIGAVNTLFVDAATFAVSAALIGLFTGGVTSEPATPEHTGAGGYGRQLREGLAFIRRDALLPSIMVVFMGANLLENALFAVLLPTYAVQVLGDPVALGLAVGALGGGAVVGAVLFGAIGHRLPRRPTVIAALAIAGPPKFLAVAASADQTVLLVVMAVSGLAAGPVNPLLAAIEYERIPARLRGRVLGAITAAVLAAVPLGALAAGWLAELTDLSTILVAAAVVYAAIALVPVLHPAWLHLDLSPHVRPGAGGSSGDATRPA